MELLLDTFLIAGIGICIYMSCWFVVSVVRQRNDVADIAWGLGFLFVTLSLFWWHGVGVDRGGLVALLVSVWALRLSGHIFLRNRHKTEDPRYKKWRDEWGKWFYLRSYLQVFMLQGVLLLAVVSPALIVMAYRGGGLTALDVLGVGVWAIGFCFEVVGDWQLKTFKNDPANKGKIMQSGLWAYTRHPNYFGEVMQWWGIWISALSVPFGWLGIVGPVVITILILYVSGIPMLEHKMAHKPAFQEYKKRVSMFFPMLPRS